MPNSLPAPQRSGKFRLRSSVLAIGAIVGLVAVVLVPMVIQARRAAMQTADK